MLTPEAPRRRWLRGAGWSTLAAALLVTPAARADDATDAEAARALEAQVGSTSRWLGSIALGRGLRLNDPYRLRTELGDGAESVSLTAPYVDLGLAYALGRPNGVQHGAALRLSLALGGVGQAVLAPTYFVAYRGAGRLLGYGRLGPTLILSPDPNLGGEVALGAAWFFTAGIGASAEVVLDLYEGAPTLDAAHPLYPIVSGQLGLVVDYEVLP